MSYLWYSAGLRKDFDIYGNFVGQNTGHRTGFYVGGNVGDNAYKVLPETGTEFWASSYRGLNISSNGDALQLRGTDNTTVLAYITVVSGYVKAYASVGGTLTLLATGTTVLQSSSFHQIEYHYKRHSTDGIFEVWVDGILEISFSGNTGSEATVIGCFAHSQIANGNTANVGSSEFIVTNKGRIGKKRMQILYLSGSGDTNTTDGFMDVIGNDTTTTSTTVKTGTYILPSAIKASGTLKTVAFNLYAADTVKIGVFTKNASAVKFTPDATRQASVACLAGAVTLNAGTDFTEWAVAAGEYIGIYTTAGKLIYTATSNNGDDLNLGSAYYISGDAFALGTEQSYSTDGSGNFIRAFAQYLTATNLMYLYNGNSNVITERPWLESKRYVSMSANGQEFLNSCTDLTDGECTAVNALKITLRGEAGTTITNGQTCIKAGGSVTYSDTIAMPTVINQRHTIFDGTWSKAQINALQIGFKALT